MSETWSNVTSPFYVIEFSPNVETKTIGWIVERLSSPKGQGGCELRVFYSQPAENSGLYLFVSVSTERAICVASQLRMRKRDLEGRLREFTHADVDFFAEKENYDCLFSEGELLSIIKYEIDNLRAQESIDNQDFLPQNVRFFQGQSIVEKLCRKGIISSIFPLQNRETLKLLKFEWCTNVMQPQPLEKIRDYFGENIAFYFAFLEEYTKFLLFPTLLGWIQYLLAPQSFRISLIFCVLYLLWAFTFLEIWKRRSSELAYTWGTFSNLFNYDVPRANFKGELQLNPITGELEPYYPRWKTLIKVYMVSVPVVFLCLGMGFLAMVLSFEAETAVRNLEFSEWITFGLVQIPGVVYAAATWVGSKYYRVLATRLTEWENHRTDSQFERNRGVKVLLFEFVNYIVFLFYIAFYKQDIALLKSQLALMLIVFQLLNHFTETLLPYAVPLTPDSENSWRKLYYNLEKQSSCQSIDSGEAIVKQALKESLLYPYAGTHEDYLELFIQLSYVLLFIVVYPMASLWAVLSNLIELRADAFKLCAIFRRPSPSRARHIGAWLPAFQFLCALAVMTNCGLLYVIGKEDGISDQDEDQSWNRAVVCLVLEHLLLGFQVLLHLIVPAVPRWIKDELATAI